MASVISKKLYFSRSKHNGFRWIYRDLKTNINSLKAIENDAIEYGWLSRYPNFFVRRIDTNILAIYRLITSNATDDFGRNYIEQKGYFIDLDLAEENIDRKELYKAIFYKLENDKNLDVVKDDDENIELKEEILFESNELLGGTFNCAINNCLESVAGKENFVIYINNGQFAEETLDKRFGDATPSHDFVELNTEDKTYLKELREVGLTIEDVKQIKKVLEMYSDLMELCVQMKGNRASKEEKEIKFDSSVYASIAQEVKQSIISLLNNGITFKVVENTIGGFRERTIEKDINIKSCTLKAINKSKNHAP